MLCALLIDFGLDADIPELKLLLQLLIFDLPNLHPLNSLLIPRNLPILIPNRVTSRKSVTSLPPFLLYFGFKRALFHLFHHFLLILNPFQFLVSFIFVYNIQSINKLFLFLYCKDWDLVLIWVYLGFCVISRLFWVVLCLCVIFSLLCFPCVLFLFLAFIFRAFVD